MKKYITSERLISIIGYLIITAAIIFDHYYLNLSYSNHPTKKQLSDYELNESISTTIWVVGFITIIIIYNLDIFKNKKKDNKNTNNI